MCLFAMFTCIIRLIWLHLIWDQTQSTGCWETNLSVIYCKITTLSGYTATTPVSSYHWRKDPSGKLQDGLWRSYLHWMRATIPTQGVDSIKGRWLTRVSENFQSCIRTTWLWSFTEHDSENVTGWKKTCPKWSSKTVWYCYEGCYDRNPAGRRSGIPSNAERRRIFQQHEWSRHEDSSKRKQEKATTLKGENGQSEERRTQDKGH